MNTSAYGAAKYDEDQYVEPMSKTPGKSGGPSLTSDAQRMPDQETRDNDTFFTAEKGDRTYPDPLMKQKDNDPYDPTDFLVCPLLPTVKRNKDNKLANHLEQSRNKVLEQ